MLGAYQAIEILRFMYVTFKYSTLFICNIIDYIDITYYL